MSVLESLPIALFVIGMVFTLLAVLFIFIVLFSYGIRAVEKRHKAARSGAAKSDPAATGSEVAAVVIEEEIFSSGHLKLQNVDERTAAMIMAIVSDESGIPLSELCFKSIKAKI